MLASLTNQYLEEIIFTLFSMTAMLFSLLSVIGRGTRLSVINFLLFSMSAVGLILLTGETAIAIIIGIVCASTCALLLLMTKILAEPVGVCRKYGTISAIFLFIPVMLRFTNRDEWSDSSRRITGISGSEFQEATMLISLIFTVVIIGLVFLLSKNKTKNLH
jgi:hypothetical protein